jgi:phage terminase large subunit
VIDEIGVRELIDLKVTAFKEKRFDLLHFSDRQIEAFEKLTDQDTEELLFGGAAGGGKSWLGVSWLIYNCLSYPDSNWFIGRLKKSQIDESVFQTTFKKVCKEIGIPKSWYRVNRVKGFIRFYNGSNINWLEMAYKPSEDPDYDRFGSTEYTGGWIEEGGNIPFKAYDILRIRIGRHMNDQFGIKGKLLITSNPSRNWMYRIFYKPWSKGEIEQGKAFIQSRVEDNVYGEKDYEQRLNRLTGVQRERLRLGNWDFENDPTQLISFEAMDNLYTNSHVRGDKGDKYLTADIALQGSDLLVLMVWYGWKVIEIKTVAKSDSKRVVGIIEALKVKHSIPNSRIIYDADGVGSFVGGFVRGANAFHNGGRPIPTETDERNRPKKPNYRNLKAQCEYLFAEKANEAQVYLWAAREDQELQDHINEELSQIKAKGHDKDGPLQTIGKDERKKNINRSPDYSDALIMRMYGEIMPKGRGRRSSMS